MCIKFYSDVMDLVFTLAATFVDTILLTIFLAYMSNTSFVFLS
jgi:hypothetical protein